MDPCRVWGAQRKACMARGGGEVGEGACCPLSCPGGEERNLASGACHGLREHHRNELVRQPAIYSRPLPSPPPPSSAFTTAALAACEILIAIFFNPPPPAPPPLGLPPPVVDVVDAPCPCPVKLLFFRRMAVVDTGR